MNMHLITIWQKSCKQIVFCNLLLNVSMNLSFHIRKYYNILLSLLYVNKNLIEISVGMIAIDSK